MRFNFNKYIKLITLVVAILYIWEHHYSYNHFVVDAYNYAGIDHKPEETVNFYLLMVVSCIPLLFFKNIKNVASGFSFMSYIFIYIPFINSLFTSSIPFSLALPYGVVFMFIMIMFFATDNISLFKQSFLRSSAKPKVNYKTFEIGVIILFLILLFIYRNNISYYDMFSESDALYDFRGGHSLAQAGGLLGLYMLLWTENVFLPILLVCSYLQKSKRFYLYIFSFILMYMIVKTKVTMVMPFVMWGALFLYRRRRNLIEKYFHIIFMIVLGLSSLYLCKLYEKDPIYTPFATLLNYRIQSVEGAQLQRYLYFFEINNNPYTYYSHIKVINAVTGTYPYKVSIGEAVAGNGSNSNATFLLMDGVAAWGIIGCLISAFLFVLIKSTLNPLSYRYKYFSLIIILLYSFNSVINTSLFTSLFSFGIIVFYIIMKRVSFPALYYHPRGL